MATYQHILARKGKAKAAHSEMTVRGLNQDNLGRATISKIINSTISPTLTYGMEAFPFTKSDYEHIDKTLIDLLSQTTKSSQSAPTWEFYEQHITPPSLTIMRNKITLYIKTTRQQGLTQSLLSSFPHNFLLREIKEIEEDWGIDLKEYMNQYKGIKLVPKKAIKDLLQSRVETKLEECLNHSTWNIHKEQQHPAPLPLYIQNPPPALLTLRLHTLLPPTNQSCSLCGETMSHPTTHILLECQHSLRRLLRSKLWEEYREADPTLEAFIKSSPSLAATRVMTGLQLLNSHEANASLLKVAVLTLSKIYTETGFVGVPLAGMSRAERAPHLSNS